MVARRPTKTARKAPPDNRPPGHDARAADRQAQALDLRLAGASYRQIARQLDCALKTAYHDVQGALADVDAQITEQAERLRDLELRRLDAWTLALAPAIRTGDPRAVLAAVRIMERRARLTGLDAPTKLAGPAGEALPVRIVMQQVRD